MFTVTIVFFFFHSFSNRFSARFARNAYHRRFLFIIFEKNGKFVRQPPQPLRPPPAKAARFVGETEKNGTEIREEEEKM